MILNTKKEMINLRYKIVITTPLLSTANKLHNLIRKSKLYNSSEIINLRKVTEVCDECNKKD